MMQHSGMEETSFLGRWVIFLSLDELKISSLETEALCICVSYWLDPAGLVQNSVGKSLCSLWDRGIKPVTQGYFLELSKLFLHF